LREIIDATQQGTNRHQAIVLAPKMGWRAGPRSIGSGRSQLRIDRIQSQVAESRHQVRIVHHYDAAEPPLKQ
jgi:hypothetical protein